MKEQPLLGVLGQNWAILGLVLANIGALAFGPESQWNCGPICGHFRPTSGYFGLFLGFKVCTNVQDADVSMCLEISPDLKSTVFIYCQVPSTRGLQVRVA